MGDIELSKQNEKNLNKYGFITKRTYDFIDLLSTTLRLLFSIIIIGFIWFTIGSFITILAWGILEIFGELIISFIELISSNAYTINSNLLSRGIVVILGSMLFYPFFLFLSMSIFLNAITYFKSGITFYGKNGVLLYGEIQEKIKDNTTFSFLDEFSENFIKILGEGQVSIKTVGAGVKKLVSSYIIEIKSRYGLLFIFCLIQVITIYFSQEILAGLKIIQNNLGGILGIWLFLWVPLLELGRYIFQSFHPLYAFGNLGERIQSLTPRIEEQSKKIQSEFQSDMNFSVLSDRFDSLSSTFSEIVSLVIKLEKIEARANKGNLFDSEKYINSLRSDIVEPLQSLKEFLQNQKTKLLDSQKELTRVRVGGSESTGNLELQSKRSESLIQELTENIEKLDMMIGKMG